MPTLNEDIDTLRRRVAAIEKAIEDAYQTHTCTADDREEMCGICALRFALNAEVD